MTATAEIHRVLKVGSEGPDVRALQAATERRLEARGINRPIKIDGVFGAKTEAAVDTATWALGGLKETYAADPVSEGAQAMIRFPGRRNNAQLRRADDRMEKLCKDREKERPAPSKDSGDQKRVDMRDRAVNAFELLYRHEPVVHYTQGGLRWQGINRKDRSAEGEYPNYADCSSAYTWCVWNAMTGVLGKDVADTVNGSRWTAGYTGTLLLHGKAVSFNELQRGDAIIYGSRWPGVHVAMYIGNGLVLSHGSESGPYRLSMRYRGDLLAARRYI